jgi:hypothetical protein
MTRRMRRIALSVLAAAMGLFLAVFALRQDLLRDPERPAQPEALAKWLAAHPADWLAATEITDRSLDSSLPRRIELWHASHQLAQRLAPLRPNTAAGFVRAGLFHWYELGPADRQAVLDEAATLMRDPNVFRSMYRPMWELTHDMPYLRRVAPRTLDAVGSLADLALIYGRFDDYRELRASIKRERMQQFLRARKSAPVGDLLMMLPRRIDTGDEPLVHGILEEIDRRPFDLQQMNGRIEDLAEYAIDHRVQPLSGLGPLVETTGKLPEARRARLALALGDVPAATRIELTGSIPGAAEWIRYHEERAAYEERTGDATAAAIQRKRAILGVKPLPPGKREWTGLCSADEVCSSAFTTQDRPMHVTLSVSQSDEVPPYVEVYADDALIAEGEVRDRRTFDLDGGSSPRRIEIRVANPLTRGGIQRRLRLTS